MRSTLFQMTDQIVALLRPIAAGACIQLLLCVQNPVRTKLELRSQLSC